MYFLFVIGRIETSFEHRLDTFLAVLTQDLSRNLSTSSVALVTLLPQLTCDLLYLFVHFRRFRLGSPLFARLSIQLYPHGYNWLTVVSPPAEGASFAALLVFDLLPVAETAAAALGPW